MDGVEILCTYPYAIGDGYSIFISCIATIVIAVLASVFLILIIESFDPIFIIISVIFGLLIGIPSGYIGADDRKVYGEEYKVTISDEVSMNEFLGKYEIISQEGKIYTVREKEGE